MKKVLFILFLTFLIMPLAFADSPVEVHRITIKATVLPVKPIFQLGFTSGMLDPDSMTVVTAKEQGTDQESTRPPIVFVPDIKLNDLNLLFTARLANEAKCYGNYTLTFEAGNFEVQRNGVSGVLSPSSQDLKVSEDFMSRGGVETELIQANSMQISFNGSRCTAGELATFEVVYLADSELDPATYYTDISLEVSSNF
ncbi:MAG: hypothetical protein IJ663_05660 [Spirochaetales bacterium]|nr:hypothetical protein [Spirochaetales bacterium]